MSSSFLPFCVHPVLNPVLHMHWLLMLREVPVTAAQPTALIIYFLALYFCMRLELTSRDVGDVDTCIKELSYIHFVELLPIVFTFQNVLGYKSWNQKTLLWKSHGKPASCILRVSTPSGLHCLVNRLCLPLQLTGGHHDGFIFVIQKYGTRYGPPEE